MFSTKRSTIIIMALALISAFLGFARESYIAFAFGATGLTDAFYVSIVLAEMIAGLVGFTLTNALIPVLKEEMGHSERSANRLGSAVFWSAMLLLTAITLIAYGVRGGLIRSLAPGFTITQFNVSRKLLAVMIFSIVLSGLSGVMAGIHNAHENFSYPGAVNVVYNVLLITVAMTFSRRFGILALAYSYMAGVLGRFIIQLVPLVRRGMILAPNLLWHRKLPDVLVSMPAIFLSTGIGVINTIVDRILASHLNSGHITDLNYATKIGLLPIGLIATTIATTVYTRFVHHFLKNEVLQLQRLIRVGTALMIFSGISIGVFMYIYSNFAVWLFFQHGAFTHGDAVFTSGIVRIYASFLPAYMLPPLLTHFFYARKENRFVLGLSAISVLINVILSVVLVGSLDVRGLAMANGTSQLVFDMVAIVVILKRVRLNLMKFVLSSINEALVPSAIFVVGAVLFYEMVPRLTVGWNDLTLLMGSFLVGALLLVPYSYCFQTSVVGHLIQGLYFKVMRLRSDLGKNSEANS